ncbi:MAG: archaellin/type IV pilin N-terminal domain-containing protein [Candidatus Nitrosocaldus sp.]
MAEMPKFKEVRAVKRGVSPIIATLMLVAIAVVGGVVVYTYFQNISSKVAPQSTVAENIQLIGYDVRQVNPIQNHLGGGIAGANNGASITYAALYIKNNSPSSLQISKVYVNGAQYNFNSGALAASQFHIGSSTSSGTNTINAASTDTLLLRLSSTVSAGTNLTVIIESAGGQQFKYEIVAGNRVF